MTLQCNHYHRSMSVTVHILMTMIQRHINLLNAWVLLTYIKLSSQYSNSRLDTGKPATATASQEGVDSLGLLLPSR